MRDSWSPFSLPPIGMVLVTVGVLVIAMASLKWHSVHAQRVAAATVEGSASPATGRTAFQWVVAPPPPVVARCNRYASNRVGHKDMRTLDVQSVQTESIFSGALYGMDESRQNDERYRLAYGSCMRARGYTR